MHGRPTGRERLLHSLRVCVAVGLCSLPLRAHAGADDAQWLAASARRLLGADQGVYVEAADGTVLVAQSASVAVHPASVSKVPTTLALLHRYGCDHRFVTVFAAGGPIVQDTLDGDLLVAGGGDPFFVDENAVLVTHALLAAGIRHVTGTVRIQGNLYFDWESDPDGGRLEQAMEGHVTAAAWDSVRSLIASPVSSAPALRFDGQAVAAAGVGSQVPRVLLTHHSQPLLAMAKALNDYSNNIFKSFAEAAGGAGSVEAYARSVLPAAMRPELTLGDGAGTDPANRMSPRVAVRLLRALEQELGTAGHSLVDILPVAGVDEGTLQKRIDGENEAGHVVGKTGTFGDYGASALIGALSTVDRGTVYFAILDHGVPVPAARHRQDSFVRALLSRLPTRRWPYTPDERPAIARAAMEPLP